MSAPKGNMFALGNNGGRPRLYEKPEEIEEQIELYFTDASERKYDLTITGLALFLGFCSRQMLYEYRERKEFSFIIMRAMLAVECGYEHALHSFKSHGAVFALKNMGWKDQVDSNVTQTIVSVVPQVINTITPLSNSEENIKDV